MERVTSEEGSPPPHPTTNAAGVAGDPSLGALIASAARWIQRAVSGWVDDDQETVELLAPIAVEHLGKATLWSRNPVLLVPLTSNSEGSLHILANKPSITNPKLRTIGLGVLLERLERSLSSFPLSPEEKRLLTDTRNGSVHVGAKANHGLVLRHSLRLCSALLEEMGTDPRAFFGDHYDNAMSILDAQRTEVQNRVLAKKGRALRRMNDLEEQLGPTAFAEASALLEAEARDALDSFLLDVTLDHPCPVCERTGRLGGFLDVEDQVDWDVEKVGDKYESFPIGYWTLHFMPISFDCNVCRFSVERHDELSSANLPAETYEITPAMLDEDFDLDDYARRSAEFD